MPEKPTVKKTTKKVIHEHAERKPRTARVEQKPEEITTPVLKPGKYFEAVGRRKTAIARVRISAQTDKVFLINGKNLNEYFQSIDLQKTALNALDLMDCSDKFSVSVKVKGGGINAQAEAIRHGITRALVDFDPEFRKKLKKSGFLTRDPRMRERKKFGLKRARRAPQWQKR